MTEHPEPPGRHPQWTGPSDRPAAGWAPPGAYPSAPASYPSALYPNAGPPLPAVPGPAVPITPVGAAVRIDPVPGTGFGVAYPAVPPTVSGLAIGSLVAGMASIAIALVVGCFGLVGGQDGWGPIVAGAFAVPAGLLGLAGLALGFAAQRQIRSGPGTTGRAFAVGGMVCGAVGVVLVVIGLVLSLAMLAA